MGSGGTPEQQRAARRQLAQMVAVGQFAPFLAEMAAAVARFRDEHGHDLVEDPAQGWEPPESWGPARRVLGGIVQALTTGFVHAGLAVVEALPPNWPPEVTLHDLAVLERVAAQEGVPVAWVPRSRLLRGVVDAGDAGSRLELLDGAAETVAQDCRVALAESTGGGADELAALAGRAADALGDGHAEAAQALAAAVLDTAVAALVTRAARNDAASPLRDRPLAALRTAIALAPLNAAFATYPRGGPVPATFNRHASVHAAGRPQYRPGNAAVAVMLVTSVLREHREQTRDPLALPTHVDQAARFAP